jgi:hypothetical protein
MFDSKHIKITTQNIRRVKSRHKIQELQFD